MQLESENNELRKNINRLTSSKDSPRHLNDSHTPSQQSAISPRLNKMSNFGTAPRHLSSSQPKQSRVSQTIHDPRTSPIPNIERFGHQEPYNVLAVSPSSNSKLHTDTNDSARNRANPEAYLHPAMPSFQSANSPDVSNTVRSPSRAMFGRENVVRPTPVYAANAPKNGSTSRVQSPFFRPASTSTSTSRIRNSSFQESNRLHDSSRITYGSQITHSGTYPEIIKPTMTPNGRNFASSRDQNPYFKAIKRPATSLDHSQRSRGLNLRREMTRTPRISSDYSTLDINGGASIESMYTNTSQTTSHSEPPSHGIQSGGVSRLPSVNSAITGIQNLRRIPFNRA